VVAEILTTAVRELREAENCPVIITHLPPVVIVAFAGRHRLRFKFAPHLLFEAPGIYHRI
jgi:hypothetical protein